MLQQTLSGDRHFDAYGEIFHDDQTDRTTNFFHYLLKNPELQVLKALPTKKNVTNLFELYLTYLQEKATKPYFFVDVKQNSLHHFNLVWSHRFSEPYLLSLIKNRSYPIVRMRRGNIFLQVLSETYAFKTGKYHFGADEIPQQLQIALDLEDFEFRMRQFDDENAFIDGHLSSYANTIRFEYEELTIDGQLKSEIYQRLGNFLQINISEQRSRYKKSIDNPRSLVSNSAQAIEYFRNTKYYPQVVAALSDA